MLDPVNPGALVRLMTEADDMIEAHILLLHMTPVTTPDLAAAVMEATRRAAARAGETSGNYEHLIATLLATALQKLATERWSR